MQWYQGVMATGDNRGRRKRSPVSSRSTSPRWFKAGGQATPRPRAQRTRRKVAVAGDGINDARSGRGRCRYRARNWNGCSDSERRTHAHERRFNWNRKGSAAQSGSDAQYPTNLSLLLSITCLVSNCSGYSLSGFWTSAESDDRRSSNEL